MKLTVIAVGSVKDRWISDGVAEYSRRLLRFTRLNIIEVPDEPIRNSFSDKSIRQAVEKEGERILARWPSDAWSIALSPGGDQLGSRGLADLISKRTNSGTSHFLFAIGGSHGLSPAVLGRCDRCVSFGPNTFPHQLFRVMLLEQIYRAEKIRSGETYHK